MLNGYSEQIKYGVENNARASKEDAASWQALQFPNLNKTSSTNSAGPLLLTNWNQSPYYNDMCPTDGSGDHAVVGCVAVAMAQVMKYYDYPLHGEGSKTYYDDEGSVQQYKTINYATKTYIWANMPSTLSGLNDDVAQLMYHCGHTVQMDWEVASSGTQSAYVVTALEDYFKYSNTANEYSKETWSGSEIYTDEEWEDMIKTELDLLRPIVYSGFSDDGGHAWNCDGYIENSGEYLYHMNYGWGGSGNGYFALDQLLSGTTTGGDEYYFDSGHQIIVRIQPEANYPEGCSGTRTITGFEGLVEDGSGKELYENNINCNTIIQPECARGKVKVSFETFDLAAGDYIYLYNGITVDDPVVAVFDMVNTPGDLEYTSTNNGMLIKFITDGSGNAEGWDLSYSSTVCSSITSTEGSGTFGDGSGSCDYDDGSFLCYWYIEPAGATQITLNFTEFDLDSPDHDYVTVYDGVSGATVYGPFKGSTPPSGNLVVNSSEVKVRFKGYSDGNAGAGWSFDYTSNVVGIDDVINVDELVKVYPNPFSSDAFVEISNTDSKNVRIILTDIVGKRIADKDFGSLSSTTTISLSDLGNIDFEKGMYLLNVQIGNQIKTYKLISE